MKSTNSRRIILKSTRCIHYMVNAKYDKIDNRLKCSLFVEADGCTGWILDETVSYCIP